MAAPEEVARLYQQRQKGIVLAVLAAILGLWRRLDQDRLTESWQAGIGPSIVSTMVNAQVQAAAAVPVYLRELAAAQNIVMPDLEVVPERLSGVSSAGAPLETALYQPIIAFKKLLADGMPPDEAMRRATAGMAMLAATQAADAGRAAVEVGMTANKGWVSYVRVVDLPACSRCIILAGRVYSHSTGFQRHPNCDCSMMPVTSENVEVASPQELFEQMSREDQDRRFTKAGAEAVRLGADMNQVVAARRGMKSIGDQLVTTEGTTSRGVAGRRMRRGQVRLMPEQIIADAAGNRDEAIRLLRENGYLKDPRQKRPIREPVTIPQQRKDEDAVARQVQAEAEAAQRLADEAKAQAEAERVRLEEVRAAAEAVAKVEAEAVARAEQAKREAAVLAQAPGMTAAVRHSSNAEGVDWAMEHVPLPTSILSREEKQAVRNYTSSQYTQVNRYLRGQMQVAYLPRRELTAIQKTIERLDSAFTKVNVEESFIVHRGVGADFATPLGADVDNPASMQALVGKTFTEKGFLSTAVGEGGTYPGSIYLMLRVPEGHEAMNVMFGTFGKAEREILLRRGTHYVVHAAYKRGPKWYVEAEIVPDDWERPDSWQPDPLGDGDRGYTVDGGTKV